MGEGADTLGTRGVRQIVILLLLFIVCFIYVIHVCFNVVLISLFNLPMHRVINVFCPLGPPVHGGEHVLGQRGQVLGRGLHLLDLPLGRVGGVGDGLRRPEICGD